MIYKFQFRTDALKEWNSLDRSIQQQFATRLMKRTENPPIPSTKLKGLPDCYTIKLRSSGFKLAYQIINDVLIIAVVAVGKHEQSGVYNLARKRLR